MTHRGARVAARAIELAISEGCFTAADVVRPLGHPPSSSTVTRVLQELEAAGWLERQTEGSSLWRAGTQARVLGDMGPSAREAADRDPVTRPDDEDGPDFTLDWDA